MSVIGRAVPLLWLLGTLSSGGEGVGKYGWV